jgi:hypothetical protein
MAETFRTTISAVFWTESTDDVDDIVDNVNAQLPAEDRASTLVTTEYRSSGRPASNVASES